MTMTVLNYRVGFNTPAFLGNAEQQGQWRAPPFKALLRQWWRVVTAHQHGFAWDRVLQQENALFGSAGDDKDGGKSKVQLRLSRWDAGSLTALPFMARHRHPDVGKDVESALYLGYGPVTGGGIRKAIAPGTDQAALQLRCPTADAQDIGKAMQLIGWFGCLGSRARNGWGSREVQGVRVMGLEDLNDATLAQQAPTRPLADAMQDRLAGEWPHAIGQCGDGRPSVWRVVQGKKLNPDGTGAYLGFDNWTGVMERLAELKIGLRTSFELRAGGPHARVEGRHMLAYPVTHHALSGLDNARMANPLRFKVGQTQSGKYFGMLVHLPCVMPAAMFKPSRVPVPEVSCQIAVWRQVHAYLGAQGKDKLARIRKS